MHPVVHCNEHEGSQYPLFDICEMNKYSKVRVPPLPPFHAPCPSANGMLSFLTKRR